MSMKIKTLLLLLFFSGAYAQNQAEAEKLINDGIALHDKGDYSAAISLYDKALAVDKDNVMALSEKAMSLNASGKYDEVITISKYTIAKHPDTNLQEIFVYYGNALDHLKRTEEALRVYDEGILKFPNYYQIYFNKGICFANSNKRPEAILCFQQALKVNPGHAGSLNALGIMEMDIHRIPSILSFSRFLIVEPQTSRSKKNFENLNNLLMQGVKQKEDQSITININLSMLSDSTGVKKADNFSQTDLILSVVAGLDFDKKNFKKTDVEKFIGKFEVICASLAEGKKENYGFYWETFVPYFLEMKNKKLLETFGYIVYADSQSEDVVKWYAKNQDQINKFYAWSKDFSWKK